MSQEFRLSVTPIREDEYLVRTEEVAPGVPLAEEQVHWPVDEWLTLTGQLMNDPLLSLLQGTKAPAPGTRNGEVVTLSERRHSRVMTPAFDLGTLGQQLYTKLFQGNLHDSWTCAQGIAQHRREVLQLRLGLKGSRLPRLPWEVLHAGDRPLAAGTDVVFSRYLPGTNLLVPTRKIATGERLKILMVIAAPSDRDSLQLKREVLHLQQELENRPAHLEGKPSAPEIQLTILEQPDRQQLTQALEQGHYQVLHYAGHSNFGARGGELYLVSDRTGLTEPLSGDDLAGLLVNNGIQMAVFNSCQGAGGRVSKAGDDTSERNLAETLVKRGIPAVLAMADRIPDEVALTLTRLFYRNLNLGYSVDLSLNRARAGLISAYSSHQLYWALPILYLHPKFDGYLTGHHPENRELVLASFSKVGLEAPDHLYPFTSPLTDPALEPLDFYPDSFDFSFGGELDPIDAEALEELVDELDYPDEWADEAENSVLIASLMRQLAGTDVLSSMSAGSEEQAVGLLEKAIFTVPNPKPAPTPPPSPQPSTTGVKPKKKWLTTTLCVLSATAAGILGTVWFWQSRGPKPGNLLPLFPDPISVSRSRDPVLSTPRQLQPVKLEVATTSEVTARAIDHFSAGDLIGGEEATEALLDRVALPQAKAVLDQVPPAADEYPEIHFLRGRLAWQFLQVGNKNYSADDARRFWELASKARPDSLKYQNALGFAHYAEGDWNRAYQIWFAAVNSVEAALSGFGSSQVSQSPPSPEDVLTAYAGLGLTLMKSAQDQPPSQRNLRLSQAVKLRQKVMTEDPLSFGADALGKNWMWPESAIKDWQLLQKQ